MRSLKETGGESDKDRIWWKKSFFDQRFAVRLSANRVGNKRADCELAQFNLSLLINAEI